MKLYTIVRFVADRNEDKTPDVTVGRIYVIAGQQGNTNEDWYFYDDVGDMNFSAAADGDGIFEIVKE